MNDCINFTPEKAQAFRKAYDAAVKAGVEVFTFEERVVLVTYAKYMLEHLATIGMPT